MKRLMLAAVGLAFLSVAGCSDAEQAKRDSWGYEHLIVRYSGGKRVEEYISTGKVETIANSDGWYFKDKHSGKVIYVSGGVTIRAYDPNEPLETELGKKWYGTEKR